MVDAIIVKLFSIFKAETRLFELAPQTTSKGEEDLKMFDWR